MLDRTEPDNGRAKKSLWCRLGLHDLWSTDKSYGSYYSITGPRTIVRFECRRNGCNYAMRGTVLGHE